MRARNQKDIEYRRKSILEAAEQIFADNEYDDITMDMIASVVQLNKRTLYLYYTNKKAIYHELFLRQSIERMHYYHQEVQKSSGGMDAIRSFGLATYDFFNNHANRHRLAMHVEILGIWQEPTPENEYIKGLIKEYVDGSNMNTTYLTEELKKELESGRTSFKSEDDIWIIIDHLYVCVRSIYSRSLLMGGCGKNYYFNFIETYIRGLSSDKT